MANVTVDADLASTNGAWKLLPYLSEVLPVHAALLHTGKVLFFAGSGNSAFRFFSNKFGSEVDKIYTSVLWDPAKDVLDDKPFHHPATLRRADGSVIDFFCSGHTFLADGQLLVVGGTKDYDKKIEHGKMEDAGHGFKGLHDALLFDPTTEQWKAVESMTRGRWYPTVVRLADERVLAFSGLDEDGPRNNTIEINTNPATAKWQKTRDFDLPLYPHLFLLQDGRIFYTGGKMDTPGFLDPFIFDPLNPTEAILAKGLIDANRSNQCASVLLPPAQAQKVMILGGGPDDETAATDRVQIIDLSDLSAANPSYGAPLNLNFNRMHVNAVLLPDRTVLATGGGGTREASIVGGHIDPQPVRERLVAEIFDPNAKDPNAKAWRPVAPATVPRLYHSVALLLPDGRVVTAGGNPDKGSQVNWLPPDPNEEMRLEIFSPPYLFKTNSRPTIQRVPANIHYGDEIEIQTPEATQIKLISLVAPGLTTHSFNSTQRLIDVPFKPRTGLLHATIPDSRTIAPPGWYMLFLVDGDGVPSIASWVQLT